MNFVTYNILSSNLSQQSSYPDYEPSHLNPDARMKLTKKKLLNEFPKQPVIALQEVSLNYHGELLPFFSENNYQFVTGMYGNKWNGYMGVGLAIPLSKYDIRKVEITRASETMQFNKYLSPAKKEIFIISAVIIFFKKIYNYFFPPKSDPWVEANWKNNQIVTATLCEKSSNRSFVVSTYHMPCAFKDPQLMVIHSALCALFVQKYAKKNGNLPYVLMGDFNFKPDSSMYQLYTKGSLEDSHPDKPTIPKAPGTNYCKLDVHPMRSAYAARMGREPAFTNSAKNFMGLFHGTLDYLFISDEWLVEDVIALPTLEGNESPPLLPNQNEPSDHLLLGAELRFL